MEKLEQLMALQTQLQSAIGQEGQNLISRLEAQSRKNREELQVHFRNLGDNISLHLKNVAQVQKMQLDNLNEQVQALTRHNEARMMRMLQFSEQKLQEFRPILEHNHKEILRDLQSSYQLLQEQVTAAWKESKQEMNLAQKEAREQIHNYLQSFDQWQYKKFTDLQESQRLLKEETGTGLEKMRSVIEQRLQHLQEDNSRKLDEMRHTVNEKLQTAVEKRFNDSFKIISERLEQVHKGLGEMQGLATGVGDLKKVLSNVKTRGLMGEIHLEAILEQILSPEQYVRNAAIKAGSQERVEYAIRLPGRDTDHPLLLPVDAKFPVEDYQRLTESYEHNQPRDWELYSKQFENAVRKNAKDIADKYLNPPYTTDFAVMFVPSEGIYAEILRRTGLFESLQRDLRITVVGPANLVAFLSSLQMGFRTLAIEKRSGEVWQVLNTVKTEFGNFGLLLEQTRKKLQEATNTIDKAGVRTRAIARQLKEVQEPVREDESVHLPRTE